ncbi:head-tail adaptor protein [Pseudophaeobacter flagellatus]|uniref:head-tail adaptor protein n=1 Tax=Pseudophaeobacter flagellatus TaxID=2899119 RepID=UPI001E57C5CF|nr:head-tail adaptor protein [Pseudophaeobacter flagellatus]MCD9149978.1 head-tail adaptor protein [Pseudophaeobacter flagellatus]
MKRQALPPLDRRVSLLGTQYEENEAGENVATGWDEIAKARANYAPVSDGERLRAAAVEQKVEARFVMRWSKALAVITGENRLRFDGADWHITGIKEIGRRRMLEISAWRVKKAGG